MTELLSPTFKGSKMKFSHLFLALCFLSLSSVANAELELGVNTGVMSVSFDELSTAEEPTNVGVSIGYRFRSVLRGIGVEFEATRSNNEGRVDGLADADSGLEVETQGVYLSYRIGGGLYLTGRVGIMKAELVGSLAEAEEGETYGLAGGIDFGRLAIELGATSVDDDVLYSSLGVKLKLY